MYITVEQTKAGAKKECRIFDGQRQFDGKAPSVQRYGTIELASLSDLNWKLKMYPPSLAQSISIGTAFGRRRRVNHCAIFQQEQHIGEFSLLRYDKVKELFELNYQGIACRIYPLFYDSSEVLLVYRDDQQIAQIERDTITYDLMDNYSIYLLDETKNCEIPLILFTLYYDHCFHGDQGTAEKNYQTKSYKYSFGEGTDRYDPDWMSNHFPEYATSPIAIDPIRYEKMKKRRLFLNMLLEVLFFILVPVSLFFVVARNPMWLVPIALFGVYWVIRRWRIRVF